MNEEVGKISYSVTIDVASLKAGTKSAEQAIKGSFNASEKAVGSSTKNINKSLDSTVAQMAILAGSIVALRAVGNFLSGAIDSANKYQASLLGLTSVSSAFIGDSQGALKAAQDLSSDGLLPLADAATGLKNLLAAGYGLEEATILMNRFKDSAAFGRQGSLQFGEAIRSATEGIKNGNSILVDNAGVTKNLSVILTEAGYSAQDMQKATTDLGVRTAILNGIVRETNAQVGDAAKLAETAAGSDAKLAFETNLLEVRIGSLGNAIRKDAIAVLADFIGANRDTIISIGSAVAVIGTVPLAILAISKAIKGLIVVMSLAAKNPFIAALSIISGIVAAFSVNNMLNGLQDVSQSAEDGRMSFKDYAQSLGYTEESMKGVSDAASDMADQIAKVERSYRESLAKIVQDHEKSIKELTKQINDENANYNAAFKKRLTDFQKEQGKEEDEHSKKVKNIQNQIDFLSKYNNANNRDQLSELKFSLAQENAEYQKKNSELQNQYDADIEAARLASTQKNNELKTKLAEETAILNRHASEVNSIRGVMLLDEIDSLKRSRDEQIASLRSKNSDTVSSQNSLYNTLQKQYSDYLSKLDKATAEYYDVSAMRRKKAEKEGGPAATIIPRMEDLLGRNRGFSSGGFTGSGGTSEVAGLVHKGEYVLPKSMVNQNTGLPKSDAVSSIGGNSSTFNVAINVSGAIVSSAQDQRKFAEVIGKRLNEVMQQKGLAQAIGGL